MTSEPETVAELVLARERDHRPGLRFEDRELSHHQVTAAAAARAALLRDLLDARTPRHLGVLLDNTPEYPLWLSAAALAGAAVAGINPTRRGASPRCPTCPPRRSWSLSTPNSSGGWT